MNLHVEKSRKDSSQNPFPQFPLRSAPSRSSRDEGQRILREILGIFKIMQNERKISSQNF